MVIDNDKTIEDVPVKVTDTLKKYIELLKCNSYEGSTFLAMVRKEFGSNVLDNFEFMLEKEPLETKKLMVTFITNKIKESLQSIKLTANIDKGKIKEYINKNLVLDKTDLSTRVEAIKAIAGDSDRMDLSDSFFKNLDLAKEYVLGLNAMIRFIDGKAEYIEKPLDEILELHNSLIGLSKVYLSRNAVDEDLDGSMLLPPVTAIEYKKSMPIDSMLPISKIDVSATFLNMESLLSVELKNLTDVVSKANIDTSVSDDIYKVFTELIELYKLGSIGSEEFDFRIKNIIDIINYYDISFTNLKNALIGRIEMLEYFVMTFNSCNSNMEILVNKFKEMEGNV